ncbi:hypothetical protein SAMN05421823_104521 [Catalinimonas alkaloidigena]|uniref:Por secretion system C-terminal sorting domain-containing protein n=1 Tax=Catalinimonas alkaloidigena TaxID=1075417 RepID=A0A1G9HS01_9BACT|nr:hypothetical protein [Catalinimonas alkaloidigena]SDL15761.1 hypothetical protein SAMN05421823_104521 [Catalinimonas alkaloidigena]
MRFVCIPLLLVTLPALAQPASPALTLTGPLSVTDGAHLYVDGDFLHAEGGELHHAGTLSLTGDLLQESATPLVVIPGQVQLVGAERQRIGGTGTGAVTFHTLALHKADTLVLDRDGVSVAGTLRFQQGHLLLAEGRELQLGRTGQLANEQETSRALGPGTLVAVATLNAPAGVNPGHLGLELTSTQALGQTVVLRSHTPQGPGQTGLRRYFQVQPTQASDMQMAVRFYYLEAELNHLDEDLLTAYTSADGTEWTAQAVAGRSKADNFVDVEGLQTLQRITLSDGATPLPVALLFFRATPTPERRVDLTWATSSEQHNAYFTVERSRSGTWFEGVASVDGAGTSHQRQAYAIQDRHPYVGTSYYRLRQTDHDGTDHFSPIAVVEIPSEGPYAYLYPTFLRTPGPVYIRGLDPGHYRLVLYDVRGVAVTTVDHTMPEQGAAPWEVQLPALVAGTYTYRLHRQDQAVLTGKLVVH